MNQCRNCPCASKGVCSGAYDTWAYKPIKWFSIIQLGNILSLAEGAENCIYQPIRRSPLLTTSPEPM